MRPMLLSALLLMALSGCGSQEIAPLQCMPMEPFPAELEVETPNLMPLLDSIITPCETGLAANTPCSNSVEQN